MSNKVAKGDYTGILSLVLQDVDYDPEFGKLDFFEPLTEIEEGEVVLGVIKSRITKRLFALHRLQRTQVELQDTSDENAMRVDCSKLSMLEKMYLYFLMLEFQNKATLSFGCYSVCRGWVLVGVPKKK